jgi:protein TonB
MKKIVLLILLALSPALCFGQEEDTTIYDFPDEDARFPGNMNEWIVKNLNYNALSAYFEDAFPGKLFFKFVVEKDGSITHVEFYIGKEKTAPHFAEKLMISSPKWIPGKINGKICRSRILLPVTICF